MNHRKTILAAALAVACIGSVSAKTEVLAHNNQVEFSGLKSAAHYQLEIKLPSGELKSLTIQSADILSISAKDLGISALSDGQYKYQLNPLQPAKSSRSAGDSFLKSNQTSGLISGVFTIKNGQSVSDQDNESRDQQILDDHIVVGSQCVGQDCVNGESFGFDTLRLKENNLRIKFQDTSASASFPSNDWQLTANDSTNGGANKFSIDDIDHATTPFTVEAGAASHSLYVDDGGRIGFGTSTPVVRNHLVDGNTPTVRLEQNGSQGWSPQTWDVAGNEAGFFIRDVTNGSKLSFRIQPNSPAQSLFIKTDGIEFFNNTSVLDSNHRLGLGTNAPQNNLHIKDEGNAAFVLESGMEPNTDTWKFLNKGSDFQISKPNSTGSLYKFLLKEDGEMSIKGSTGLKTFDLDANGNLIITGALTQNSDVNTKENIHTVNTAEILNKVMSLPISVWNYKFDDDSVKHLGPMAQDFFNQFNLGHTETKIATIDTSGVALASIKELGTQLAKKEAEINTLKAENEKLNDRLAAIEEAIQKLQ